MRKAFVLIVTSLLLSFAQTSPADVSYRVSGIVGQENRWLFAVIEDSGGRCGVYTKGDLLGNGIVIDVTPQGVLVEADGKINLLKLEGSSFVARSDDGESGHESNTPVVGAARPVMGKLSPQELAYTVKNMVTELERDKNIKLEPEMLNSILDLPVEARIIAVNEKPVHSSREAVIIVHTAINNNMPLDFIVSGGGIQTKIYFQPNQPSMPHPHE